MRANVRKRESMEQTVVHTSKRQQTQTHGGNGSKLKQTDGHRSQSEPTVAKSNEKTVWRSNTNQIWRMRHLIVTTWLTLRDFRNATSNPLPKAQTEAHNIKQKHGTNSRQPQQKGANRSKPKQTVDGSKFKQTTSNGSKLQPTGAKPHMKIK